MYITIVSKPRVALMVSNPYRGDLVGLVLVGMRLVEQGITSHLVSIYHLDDLLALAPDLILLSKFYKTNVQGVESLLSTGVNLGVLDTEGGVLGRFDFYEKTIPESKELRDKIAFQAVWGAKVADYFIANNWYNSSQVQITGMPRFDMYAPLWRQAALDLSPYAECYPSPMVLINGNFPIANPMKSSDTSISEMMGIGYTRSEALEFQKQVHRTMVEMVDLANTLAEYFPHVHFVYRPHPFENIETYKTMLKQRDNLHLNRDGSVDGWIIRASAVIQRSCSTAIESALAGIPTLSPTWIPTATLMPEAEEVSLPCTSFEELKSHLADIITGKKEAFLEVENALKQVIEDWYYAIDGYSHQRVADTISRHLPESSPPINIEKYRQLYYLGLVPIKSARNRFSVRLKLALGLPKNFSFRRLRSIREETIGWDSSGRQFNLVDVQRIVDAINAAREINGLPVINVMVSKADGDYYFRHMNGRAIVLSPS